MPILTDFAVPSSARELALPDDPNSTFFITFISSKDPITKVPWCPDVVAILPQIESAFSAADAPEVAVVEVGQRPEWKTPNNIYRVNWNISGVPSLVRFQRVDGEVRETGHWTEFEIVDDVKLLKDLARKTSTA